MTPNHMPIQTIKSKRKLMLDLFQVPLEDTQCKFKIVRMNMVQMYEEGFADR